MANYQNQRGNGRQNNQQSTDVVVLAPPRMKPPAGALEQYKLTPDSWRAVIDAVFPLAKTVGAVAMALAYCDRHKLDVFQRVVHIVPMRVGTKMVETVWPGIGLYRIRAQRQPDFDGWDDCAFGPDKTHTFKGKKAIYGNRDDSRPTGYEDIEIELTFPEWAQFTVYAFRHGRRIALPGPKTWFMETFSEMSAKVKVPNDRWQRAPRQMLEKCAEAAALRRAWPDVFGDEMVAEEAEGKQLSEKHIQNAEYVEVNDEETGTSGTDTGMPTRGDFVGEDGDGEHQDAQAQAEGARSDAADRQDVGGGAADEGAAGADRDDQAAGGGSEREADTPAEYTEAQLEEWGAWLVDMRSKIKTRASHDKLKVLEDNQAENIAKAPPVMREEVEELIADKRASFAQAK